MEKSTTALKNKEEFHLSLPIAQQNNIDNLVMPEFFFLKKKKKEKKKGDSLIKRFFKGDFPKIIIAFDVVYLTLGYFTNFLGIDDYIVFASLVLTGSIYSAERLKLFQPPPVCYFTINSEFIEYHFEAGVKEEMLKLLRMLRIKKAQRVNFKNISHVEFPFKALVFTLKQGKLIRMELIALSDSNVYTIQKQVEWACRDQEIPCTLTTLTKSFQEKQETKEKPA